MRRHEQPDHTESTALPAIQNRATNSTDSRYQDRSFATRAIITRAATYAAEPVIWCATETGRSPGPRLGLVTRVCYPHPNRPACMARQILAALLLKEQPERAWPPAVG